MQVSRKLIGIKIRVFKIIVIMAVTLIRTLIIFITLIIVMRLMGKRQIGEMQPFEFVITLIIADLACVPMADVSIPLIYGIVAILALFVLHQLLSFIEQGGRVAKLIVSGKPSIVINKNGVDIKELKKNNMGLDDLIESMRSAGYFSLDDVDYAIFESNGKLSTLENTQRTDKRNGLPLILISDGKIENKNLSVLKIDKSRLESILKENGVNVKKTEVLTVDGNGRAYLKGKNKKYEIINVQLGEEIKW